MSIQGLAIQHYMHGVTRNLLTGASLCYAIKNETYLQVPLTILFPSIYSGYHLYKNKENVIDWIHRII